MSLNSFLFPIPVASVSFSYKVGIEGVLNTWTALGSLLVAKSVPFITQDAHPNQPLPPSTKGNIAAGAGQLALGPALVVRI